MNRLDCGNQRTGHPRCAQLMANTWNCFPSTLRTQQAMSAVSPSQAFTIGLRYVARRVSPAGNLSSEPRGSQESYSPLRSRVTGDARYRTIGTARVKPTMPLNTKPIFAKNPRLVTSLDEDVIEFLQ